MTILLRGLEEAQIRTFGFWLQVQKLKRASLEWGEFGELLEGDPGGISGIASGRTPTANCSLGYSFCSSRR